MKSSDDKDEHCENLKSKVSCYKDFNNTVISGITCLLHGRCGQSYH